MTRFERNAWLVAAVLLGLWAVGFGGWIMLTPS